MTRDDIIKKNRTITDEQYQNFLDMYENVEGVTKFILTNQKNEYAEKYGGTRNFDYFIKYYEMRLNNGKINIQNVENAENIQKRYTLTKELYEEFLSNYENVQNITMEMIIKQREKQNEMDITDGYVSISFEEFLSNYSIYTDVKKIENPQKIKHEPNEDIISTSMFNDFQDNYDNVENITVEILKQQRKDFNLKYNKHVSYDKFLNGYLHFSNQGMLNLDNIENPQNIVKSKVKSKNTNETYSEEEIERHKGMLYQHNDIMYFNLYKERMSSKLLLEIALSNIDSYIDEYNNYIDEEFDIRKHSYSDEEIMLCHHEDIFFEIKRDLPNEDLKKLQEKIQKFLKLFIEIEDKSDLEIILRTSDYEDLIFKLKSFEMQLNQKILFGGIKDYKIQPATSISGNKYKDSLELYSIRDNDEIYNKDTQEKERLRKEKLNQESNSDIDMN